jgi:hypothetical protein
MESEGSLLHSQEPSTCFYLESDQSSLHRSISPPQGPSYYYPTTYVLVFLAVFFPLAFLPMTYTPFSSIPFVLHGRPYHPPRLDYSNYAWRKVQIMKSSLCSFPPSCRLTPSQPDDAPCCGDRDPPNIMLKCLCSFINFTLYY